MAIATHLLSCLLLALLTLVSADDVFVSIDCGSSTDTYKDENLLVWNGDEPFTKTGESYSVQSNRSISHVMDTLRVFTTRKKNCYHIDTIRRGRVLIRASFYYGNYDNKSSPPTFDLHFDGNYWATVQTNSVSGYIYYEVIYVMKTDNISVCVAQTLDDQFPFISAIEVRGLDSHMYWRINIDENYPLYLMSRVDYGGNTTTRYTDDPFDRLWIPFSPVVNGLTRISTNATISVPGVGNGPPPAVLRTAMSTVNPNASLPLFMGLPPFPFNAYIIWYFTEVALLEPNQLRSFRIFMNDNISFSPPIIPIYQNFTQMSISNFTFPANTTFSLVPEKNSTLPPLINAVEVFFVGNPITNGTNDADVEGLSSLQNSFEVLQKWRGDPCLPSSYSWEWINCTSEFTPRVTALFLGSFGLSGLFPNISSMDHLEIIDLRNNSLNGTIPDFLGALPKLKQLNLANNHFTGLVPSSLSQKSSLILVLTGNPDLCTSSSSCPITPNIEEKKKKKKSKLPIILGITIPCVLIVWIIVGILVMLHYKGKFAAVVAQDKDKRDKPKHDKEEH